MVQKSLRSVGRKKRNKNSKTDNKQTAQKAKGMTLTRKAKKEKKVDKTKSNHSTSQHEKEEKKGQRSERHRKRDVVEKSKVSRMEVKDREKEKEEKEQDSESDAEREPKKVNKSQPKNVNLKHRDVDETEMKKLMEKLKVKKAQPQQTVMRPVSEKDKILMDRVVKKSSYKYCSKNPLPLMTQEEDTEFFKKPAAKKPSTVTAVAAVSTASSTGSTTPPPPVVEETYDHVPKLEDVLKLPDKNVYTTLAVPFWAVSLEPEDEDLKDVQPPISVGSEHVEMYHDKKFTLKVPKNVKLVLDEWQTMAELAKRDETNFHTHLVFSNTVRSLINVNMKVVEKKRECFGEEPTQAEENVSFSKDPPVQYIYDRAKPIESAREKALDPEHPNPSPASPAVNAPATNLPTTSTSTSTDK